MSDDEKPVDDLRAKAALAMAKHAFESALEDPAEKDARARKKRNKRIALVAIGLLVAVGLLGLMLHYWYWSLLLGALGAVGLYARHRWRARRASQKKIPAAPQKVRIAAPEPARIEEPPDAAIDEDLAELKARLKR